MALETTEVTAPNEPAYALLAQMHRRAFAPQGDNVWSASAFRQLIESPGVSTCICQKGDQPFGFYMYRAVLDEAELLTIAVEPDYRGQGLSGVMMQHMLAALRNGDIKHLFLEVRKDNIAAIKLYEKQGFVFTGERKNYYKVDDGRKVDALVFSLNL